MIHTTRIDSAKKKGPDESGPLNNHVVVHSSTVLLGRQCQGATCLTRQVKTNRLVLAYTVVLANDAVPLGVVDQTAMLLASKHVLSICRTFDEYQVDVDHREADEDEHHEVMDDAHGHHAAHSRRTCSEEAPRSGRDPKAEASVAHNEEQQTDEEIGELLGHAKLR